MKTSLQTETLLSTATQERFQNSFTGAPCELNKQAVQNDDR
jgi:hypothetical protein